MLGKTYKGGNMRLCAQNGWELYHQRYIVQPGHVGLVGPISDVVTRGRIVPWGADRGGERTRAGGLVQSSGGLAQPGHPVPGGLPSSDGPTAPVREVRRAGLVQR